MKKIVITAAVLAAVCFNTVMTPVSAEEDSTASSKPVIYQMSAVKDVNTSRMEPFPVLLRI